MTKAETVVDNIENVRYIYFGHNPEKNTHRGIVSVGYKFDLENKDLIYSAAFCSPKDRFSKKEARNKIQIRMENGKFRKIKKSKFDKLTREPKYADCITYIHNDLGLGTEKVFHDLGLKRRPFWFESISKLDIDPESDIQFAIGWTIFDYLEIFQQNFSGDKTASGEEKFEKFTRGIRHIAKHFKVDPDQYDQHQILLK